VAPAASTVERVEQRVIRVDRGAKPATLVDVLQRETVDRALIFTRTKHGADKVVRGLVRAGIAAEAIHGNKSQGQRERVLAAFRKGEIRTLVATDIAARGIDVDGISHVVNFDLPNIPETYVHRIGRTARAGAEGVAISLCDADEVAFLRDIEKLIRISIPVSDQRANPHQIDPPTAKHASGRSAAEAPGKRRRGRNGHGGRKQSRHDQPRDQARDQSREHSRDQSRDQAPGPGIGSVAFLHRNAPAGRDAAPRAPRWTSHSKGS
jgi:superfamily II DNA/RNA helicase